MMLNVTTDRAKTSVPDEAAAALAWHDGDAMATIMTLLDDCWYLRVQLTLAEAAMSKGFSRGWTPTFERGD